MARQVPTCGFGPRDPWATLALAKDHLGRLGMSLRKTDEREYRVTFRPPPSATRAQLERLEALAAYCPDLQEAVWTGAAMHAHRARHPEHYRDLGDAK